MHSTPSFRRSKHPLSIAAEARAHGFRARSHSGASSTRDSPSRSKDLFRPTEASLTKFERDLVQRAFEEVTQSQGLQTTEVEMGSRNTIRLGDTTGAGLSTGLFITGANQIINIFSAVNLPFTNVLKEMEEEDHWVSFQLMKASTVGRGIPANTTSGRHSRTELDLPSGSPLQDSTLSTDPPLTRMSLADLFLFMRKLKAVYLSTYQQTICSSPAAAITGLSSTRVSTLMVDEGRGVVGGKGLTVAQLNAFKDTVEAVDAFNAITITDTAGGMEPQDPSCLIYDRDVDASLDEFGLSKVPLQGDTQFVSTSLDDDRTKDDDLSPLLQRQMSDLGNGSLSPSQIQSQPVGPKKMDLASFVSNVLGEESSRALNAVEVQRESLTAMKGSLRKHLGVSDVQSTVDEDDVLLRGKMSLSATAFARTLGSTLRQVDPLRELNCFSGAMQNATPPIVKRLKEVREEEAVKAGGEPVDRSLYREKRSETHSRFATKRELNPTYSAFRTSQDRKRRAQEQLAQREERIRSGEADENEGNLSSLRTLQNIGGVCEKSRPRPDSRQGVFAAVLDLAAFVKPGGQTAHARSTGRLATRSSTKKLPPLNKSVSPILFPG